jgi:hypothetical protein
MSLMLERTLQVGKDIVVDGTREHGVSLVGVGSIALDWTHDSIALIKLTKSTTIPSSILQVRCHLLGHTRWDIHTDVLCIVLS